MAVENARERTGILQDFLIEVAQVRVDRGQSRDSVTLTQREHILPTPGRISYIDVNKSAIEKGCKRNDRGERATRVQSLVHCIPALLDVTDANVGVFHLEKLEDRFPK